MAPVELCYQCCAGMVVDGTCNGCGALEESEGCKGGQGRDAPSVASDGWNWGVVVVAGIAILVVLALVLIVRS